MTVQERYEAARKMYADIGVDTDAAIARLKEIPVSLHCWQGDDVTGFDHDGSLTGGIQTTGNYPGKAKTPEQLMQDMEEAMSLMPGKKKLNLHASYAFFEKGEFADRDKLEPKQFMGGIHAMTEDFQQMVPYGKPCHILNQNFRVVQNNGETCTIAGECLISTDADVEQDIQTLMHYSI